MKFAPGTQPNGRRRLEASPDPMMNDQYSGKTPMRKTTSRIAYDQKLGPGTADLDSAIAAALGLIGDRFDHRDGGRRAEAHADTSFFAFAASSFC